MKPLGSYTKDVILLEDPPNQQAVYEPGTNESKYSKKKSIPPPKWATKQFNVSRNNAHYMNGHGILGTGIISQRPENLTLG